jgi:hypothetical protein
MFVHQLANVCIPQMCLPAVWMLDGSKEVSVMQPVTFLQQNEAWPASMGAHMMKL